MTKTELISKVAEKSGLSKKDSDIAISTLFNVIIDTVASGEKISIVGFGSFERGFRKERVGHNPQTKAEITIPESHYPKFKSGKSFKDACN